MALKWDITGNNSGFIRALQESENAVNHTSDVIERNGGSIERTFKRIQQAAALSVAGFSAQAFIRQAASIRGEFQKLEVAFSTMLESEEKANELMQQLTKTAAITPFDLKGVADGAKQLMAYGVAADEVNDVLIHLGDIAAGLSLPLGDLVYLYGTTMTQGRMFTQDLRQFMGRGIPLADELAKQFGVAKEKVGELVTAGKVGADEFKKAIMALSSEGGKFGGLMEKQSKTIQGQISNIEDAIDVMFNDIGKQSEGVINASLDVVSTLVEHWEDVGAAILAAAEAYGIYKATLMTMTAYSSAATNIGYDAEIASLSKLLPMKEAEANADLQIAVAEGRLSASKAETIAAMRMEVNEQLKVLAVKEAAAEADYKAALEQHLIAQRNMAVAQSQVKIALESGTAEEVAAAKRGAATAKQELQTAAIAKNTAHKELNTVSTQKNALANGLDAAATAGNTAATGILTQAKLALKRAIDAVNASFLASPIFWIAAAIAGVTFAIYKLVTAETAEEAARRKANEQIDEFNKKLDEKEAKIKEHIATIKSETATEYQKVRAYEALKQLMPTLTSQYSRAEIAALDMADAQQKINEVMDEAEFDDAKTKVEEYKKSVEKIKQLMADDAKYNGGRNAIFNLKQLERAEADLAEAGKRLREILNLRAKAADEARPIEVRLEEARENEAVRQRIFDFYDKAMSLTADWQSANETINFATGQTRLDEFIENAQNELDDLREQQKKNPIDEHLRLELNEKQRILSELLTMKANWTSMGVLNLPFTFSVNYASAQAALEAAKQKAAGLAAQQANSPTLAEAYNKAQEAYNKAKELVQKMEKNRSAYTQKQWEDAQSDLKEKKQTFSGLGGDTSDKSKNAASNRQQQIREQQRYNDLERRMLQERERSIVDLQLSINQAEIDAMQDGTEKTIKQLELDFKKRKEEIERGYADLKQQKIDSARQLFEANPANKNKVFDQSTVNTSYTKEESENYRKQLEANLTAFRRAKDEERKAQAQAMLDYLKEYGSMEQQRYAIAKEYDEKIAKEQDEWRKKSLEAEKKNRLAQMDAQSLAENIDWNQTFSGIGNVLKDIAKDTLEEVEAYMKTADFKSLGAEAKEAYANLRKELVGAGGRESINPFSSQTWDDIARLANEYRDAVKNVKLATETHREAVERVAAAEKKVEEAANGSFNEKAIAREELEDAKKWAEETKKALENEKARKNEAGQQLTTTTEAASQGLQDFSTVLGQITSGSLTGFVLAVGNIIKQISGSGDKAAESIGELFGEAGKQIGGIIGAILQIIDALGDDPAGFIDQILDKVANVVEAVISQIPEIIANVIKGVGNIIGGVFSGIGGLFGFGIADNSAYEAALDKWGGILDAWESNVKYERELMEKAYGVKAIDYSKQALKALEDAQKAASEIYKGWADSGAGWFSHSHGYETNRDTNWKYLWDYDENLAKQLGVQEKYWLGGGKIYTGGDVSKLFDLTWEQLEQLQNRAPQFWASMSEEARKYLENFIEAGRTAQETLDALNEQLTTTTKENVFDDFLNSLYDLADGSEGVMDDIASNWKKMVNRMIINNTIGAEFQEQVKKWYERLASLQEQYTNGGMKETEYKKQLDSLYADYEDMVDKAQAKMEDFTKRGIIQPIETAGEKAFSSMRDSFLNALTDMNSGTLDFMEDFINTMVNELVDKFVLDDEFTRWMNNWKQQYTSIINDNNLPDEERIKKLKALMSDLADKQGELNEKARVWTEAFKIPEDVFADLAENFKTSILDMEQTADDFVGSLKTNFRKAITNAFVMTPEVKNQIEEWVQKANELTNPNYKGARYEALKSRYDDPELGWIFKYLKESLEDLNMVEIAPGGLDALRVALEAIGGDYEVLQAIIESFNFQPEEAEAIINEFIQLEAALQSLEYSDTDRASDIEEHANALKAFYESLEAKQEYWDKLLGFGGNSDTSPFDNLRDSFLDTLLDMESDAKGFRRKLEETLVKDLMERQVLDVPLTVKIDGEDKIFDNFDKYSEDWNKRYMEAVKGGNTELADTLIDELMQVYGLTMQQAENLRDRLKEIAQDTTFKDMTDSWVSSLMDFDKTAEDWAENIGRTMAQKIIEQMIVPTMMQPLLDTLQTAFDTAMSEHGEYGTDWDWKKIINAEGVQDALNAIQTAYPDLKDTIGSILAALNITPEADAAKEAFGDLTGTIVSGLTDAEQTAEDFSKNLVRTLTEQMIKSMIDTQFADTIKAIQDDWAKALESGDTSAIEDIRKRIVKLYEDAGRATEELRGVFEDLKKDTTFKDMADSWADALTDMETTAADFGRNIGQTLVNKLVKELVVTKRLQKYLDDIQKAYDEAIGKDGATIESVLEAVIPLIDQAVAETENWKPVIENIAKRFQELDDSTPLDGLRSNFLSQLMDMESSTQDFARSINEILTEAFIDRFVLGEAFDQKLEQWKDEYARIMGNPNKEERAKLLKQLGEAIAAESVDLKKQANEIKQWLGTYEYEDSQATMNMADKITYDQADMLLGINMAQEMTLEQILATLRGGNTGAVLESGFRTFSEMMSSGGESETSKQILAALQNLGSLNLPDGDTVKEIRGLIKIGNGYLCEIRDSNASILQRFGEKLDSIDGKLARL